MTEPTAPAKVTKAAKATPRTIPAADKPATKKATKAAAKPEFNPTVKDNGKLDHSTCGHPRTPAGRAACRANRAEGK
ncbi:hypothetical protein [Phytohabitans aurantiacus]|uniref:Uncharacterized protein n=1 Tax=Phytohabitans aurantiacus TaxID=3016789 RepID=A0ABQ5R2M1_9ACTN|nr:hypothetical protein [Phytohabitans aurantiacus]GLI00670.1 hypothetical protein Pa4123_59460 [Phytohabitans aurantiacus]